MPQVAAIRYARALAEAVLGPKSKLDGKAALDELSRVDEMMRESPDLRNIFLSPAVQAKKKRAVVARFAEILPLDRLIRNFLYVLIDHHRIGMLAEVREAFATTLDERMGILRAQVSSAAPLDTQQQSALQTELSHLTGKQVLCDFQTDEELLGGVMARIGSTIYDGSVRAQLDRMRQRLVER
jgi:F-type H+-transporting ATPase subunit delta